LSCCGRAWGAAWFRPGRHEGDLQPAICLDIIRQTQNYGFLYIAQGIGAIFGGPAASLLHGATGGWTSVFAVAIAADLLAAILAIAALKPMRRAHRLA